MPPTNSLFQTTFQFTTPFEVYKGKVRDVYTFGKKMAIVSSDRISAFDVILPEAIPYKGEVLNRISWFFMQQTADIVPHWVTDIPHPNVSFGHTCRPIPIEMVIRGHLAGSAWRAYQKGQRVFNGYQLPDGLRENDPLPYPILTPATKAAQGDHDEDIDQAEILNRKLLTPAQWEQVADVTLKLFARGQAIAKQKGLILADTKYEFGWIENNLYLIDEIHTPDSSRYFDIEGFEERQNQGKPQPQRSKEMVRQWLLSQGFSGQAGQSPPPMEADWIQAVSQEYILLFEQLTGEKISQTNLSLQERLLAIETAIQQCLSKSNDLH
ncbi:MAG TPA: phosphoribosylaminoimidazolesuccinocarboxamide synthase [Microscillaceae bacterium]|nr:phosphoribosylaminoimidazolesuccinocarboxamide synthase [Microscillaceae bacterium]